MKDLSKEIEQLVQSYATAKSFTPYEIFDLALKTQHNRILQDALMKGQVRKLVKNNH